MDKFTAANHQRAIWVFGMALRQSVNLIYSRKVIIWMIGSAWRIQVDFQPVPKTLFHFQPENHRKHRISQAFQIIRTEMCNTDGSFFFYRFRSHIKFPLLYLC